MMIRIEVKHMQKDANRLEMEMLKKAEEQEFPILVADENDPFPFEIESAETVVLPEIQSMTEYIRRHYERKITAELERRIRCGKLGVIQEGRLFRNPDRDIQTMPLTVNPHPKKNSFVWANYRRVAECCIQAELTYELEVEISRKSVAQTVRQRYDVDMWFDMEGEIAGEYGGFRLHRHQNENSGVKLDEYLIPVFKWEDVEDEAEEIIYRLVPEGFCPRCIFSDSSAE